jgi:hypothetical protein
MVRLQPGEQDRLPDTVALVDPALGPWHPLRGDAGQVVLHLLDELVDPVPEMVQHVGPERAVGVGDAVVVEILVGGQGDRRPRILRPVILDPSQLDLHGRPPQPQRCRLGGADARGGRRSGAARRGTVHGQQVLQILAHRRMAPSRRACAADSGSIRAWSDLAASRIVLHAGPTAARCSSRLPNRPAS